MSTKLFVGNLSYSTTENDLHDLFSSHGDVTAVDLIIDKMSGRSRGFAFVTMSTEEGAFNAKSSLQGANFGGRDLTINEARPRTERPMTAGGNAQAGRPARRDYNARP